MEPESVHDGHSDESQKCKFFWYFRVLLTCIKVAMIVRGGVLKSTPVVGNDTTVHCVHTDSVVLIKCSIWDGSRKRSTAHYNKKSYFIFISVSSCV